MSGTRVPEPPIATTAARARRLWEMGAFERARALVVALAPWHAEALLTRADFHLHIGAVSEALAAYREAARLAPGSVHALRGEAAAMLHLASPREALATAQRAHALADATRVLDPAERANVLTVLAGAQGLAAQAGGWFTKVRYGPRVRAGFEAALALDPENPYAHTGLGRFFLSAPAVLGGDPARALRELEIAMGLAPFYYFTHAWYVRALEAVGAQEEAVRQRALYAERYEAYPGALAALVPGRPEIP